MFPLHPNSISRLTFYVSRIRHQAPRSAALALTSLLTLAGISAFAQPANDSFTNAISLSGANGITFGNNINATIESGEPDTIDGAPSGSSVWYTWTAPASGTATFSTGGSIDTNGVDPMDTLLGVYTGTAVDALISVAENDDSPSNVTSIVSFPCTAGTTYMVLVSGFAGVQGSIALSWSSSTLTAGDFHWTGIPLGTVGLPVLGPVNSSLYIFSDYDSFPPGTTKMGFITNRFTLTRTAGASGRVLVNYTVTNGFYVDGHITNIFGTNFCSTNIDNLTGNVYFTNILYTNIVITNIYQNMEYGQIVAYREVFGFSTVCTNATLFSTNAGPPVCSTTFVPPQTVPTNYPCLNMSQITITNIVGTNPPSDNTLILATNFFCMSTSVLETNRSAIPVGDPDAPPFMWSYIPIVGTATNDDFQMNQDIQVIVYPTEFYPYRNQYLLANIDSVSLDPDESPDIGPPISSVTNAIMNILNSFDLQGGTNSNPADFGIVGFPGSGVLGTNVINFERSTIRCARNINGAFARIWVYRGGFIPPGSSASVNYRIDYTPFRLPHENANDLFRFTGADFSNPEIPLQAGSEYATPTNSWDFSPSPIDFDSVTGTLTFGSGVGGVSLDIPITPITNSTVVNFNKDILVQLYFTGSPPDPNQMSLGYVRDCVLTVLFEGQPAGAVDQNHNPDRSTATLPPLMQHPGANGPVFATALQPDGRALIGGDFSAYNATLRNRIARINVDGSIDTSFDPGSGANQTITCMSIDPLTTKILIGGSFTSFNGTQRNGIARLTSSGSLDGSFNPALGANGTVWSVAQQGDGKVLIAGEFTSFNGTPRNYLARLNADGSLDSTFAPGAGPNNTIHVVALQPDGKILIGGDFTQVAGNALNHFARLNADGSVDNSYNISIGADDSVFAIALQADGKALIGGAFHTVGNLSRNAIARINTGGSVDLSFTPAAGADNTIYSILVQPDQEIILGGLFSTYNETHRMSVARIFSNGILDTSFMDTAYNEFAGLPKHLFNPSVEGHPYIFSMALQLDGNVLIAGGFDRVGGGGTRDDIRNRNNFARLLGGGTPGPGNIQLAQDTYNADENAGPYFLTLNRANGILGPAGATVVPQVPSPGPGSAVLSNDFFFQAKYANPTYITTWPLPTWQLSDGTDGQNQGASGTVQPGATLRYPDNDVFLNIIDNQAVDGNRSMSVELHNPTDRDQFLLGGQKIPLGVALGRSSAPLTIVDNDVLNGTIGFVTTNFNVNETAGSVTVTVVRTNGNGNLTVQYATSDGTAIANRDYKAKSGQLNFGSGVNTNFITVLLIHNGIATDDLAFNLRLFNVTGGGNLGISNATVTVIDADSPNGRLRFASPTFATNENAGSAIVTVRRGGGSAGTLSVSVATLTNAVPAATTAVPGIDYIATTNTLIWNPNDVADKTLTVPLIDNQIVDGNRSLNVRLFNPMVNSLPPTNVVVGSGSNSVLTILDDDAFGFVAFTRPTYIVRENGGPAIITVQRTSGIAQSLSVNFGTSGGSAVAGSHYTPTNGILTFAPGEISKSFTIPILDNFVTDGNRTIGLSLSGANPLASLGFPSSALVTIVDDETFNQPPGSIDTTLDPSIGFNAPVLAMALQTNGMILAGGDFTLANNLVRNRIARLNPDGSLDNTFSTPTAGANDTVRAIVSQSDTRVLIGGFFTNVNGTIVNHITRLNYNGTLDSTFNVGAGADNIVYSLAETFDSVGTRKLYVGGAFLNINSTPRSRIARLNDNGTVDASFAPGVGADGAVYAIVPYPTNSVRAGQVLIGGDFTSINGVARGHIARLKSDGSVDLAFNPSSGANDSVRAIALQTDERILIGGLFTNVNGLARSRIARLNADGSADSAFNPGLGANDAVSGIILQPDNRILLAGQFTIASGVTRHRITRLNPDGSVDPAINFGLAADNFVSAILLQPDNKVVLGGGFTHYDGFSANYLTRIYGGSVNGSGNFEFGAPIYGVNEDATNAVVTIRRRGGTAGFPSGNVFVTLSTSNGTALGGINYSNVNSALSFPVGEVIQSVTIPVVHDFIVTPDLNFSVGLSNPQPPGGPAIGNQAAALVILTNVDSTVSFASSAFSINEDTSQGVATIQLNRAGSTVGSTAVDFRTTTNGTAVPGLNYTPVTNNILFVPGQSNAFVSVPVFHDPSANGDRTVSLQLSNAVGSILISPNQATLNIIDVERAPGLFVFSSTNYAASQALGFVTVTVVRTNGHSGDVSVQFATADSNALAGVDYIATNGSLSFASGETVKSFNVKLLDKPFVQNPRTFLVNLSGPLGGATIGTPTVPVTIFDYHVGLTFSSPTYAVSEDGGALTVSVLRLNGSNGPVSVQYASTNGTATAGVNYTTTAGTLSFANGETLKTFSVPVQQDHRITGNQTFGLSLFNVQPPAAAQLVTSSSTVTLLDTTVGFLFSNAVYSVSKAGTNVSLTVIRTNSALAGTNVIGFSTADGSAIAGPDYTAVSGSLTFTNGESFKNITVPIVQNTLVEGDLFFTVSLITNSLSVGALLVDPSLATVTIIDDNAGFRFSTPNYSVNEGGVSATIAVQRTGVLTNTCTIDFSTADGSSVAFAHYFPTNGTLIFTNGETVKYFTVPVIDETSIEGNHTVLLSLSNPTGHSALLAPSAAVLTIIDNDGSLVVPAGSALSSESGPVNGIIDPGETVTMLLGLRNSVGSPTTNLVATLLATNGVTPVTTSQGYGALIPGGASVSRPFTFTANGTNGGVVTVTLRLTDGSSTNGFPSTAVFAFTLGSSTSRYTNSGAITIQDNTNAAPYPSSINVSSVNGVVTRATVLVTNFSHTSAFDVDVLLSSPGGANMLLMANAGGHTALNRAYFTFDDSAASFLSQSGPLSSGTYKPTAYLPIGPFPSPAAPGPYATNLAACSNSNPNGTWSLYVADSRPLDTGGITNGWVLSLTTAAVVPPNANLSLAASVSPSTVVVGSNLVYSIAVSNYGPSTATGIAVTNILPASATFLSASIGGYALNGNVLAFTNLGSLPSGGSLAFTVSVRATLTGAISNIVSVAGNEFDPFGGDNSVIVPTTVISPSADLTLTLSDAPDPVTVGGDLVYSINVSNAGPATATSVKLTNTLPASVTFVSASPGYTLNGNVVTFDLANLGSGIATNCSITVHPTALGTLTEFASVGSTVLDPFKINNSASVKTLVESVRLAVQRSGSNFTISWPASASTYVLESSIGLNPAAWSQVTSPPVQTIGDQNVITVPITNAGRLFRLRAPAP